MKKIFNLIIGFCFFQTNLVIGQVIHDVSSNSVVKEFFISGPYVYKDDKEIKPIELLEIEFIDNESSFTKDDSFLNGQIIRSDDGNHNLNKVLDDTSYAVAYLHTTIHSKDAADAHFLLSTQDGAKLFVNGTLEHSFYSGGGFNFKEEHVIVSLGLGDNDLVLKVPNKDWGWSVRLKILDLETGDTLLKKREEEYEYFQFLNMKLRPLQRKENNMLVPFKEGSFPDLNFDRPGLAKKYLGGDYRIILRWFDTDLNEVNYPKETGRYGYYSEAIGKNGKKLKRSGTLFCTPNDWMGWNNRLNSDLDYFPISQIREEVWSEHREAIRAYLGHQTLKSFRYQDEEVILLCFLHDVQKKGYGKDKKLTPLIYDGDYHAAMKQKILGQENKYKKLALPKRIKEKPKKLRPNQKQYAKKNKKFIRQMNEICEQWIADDGSPFDVVVAKDGNIIFHKAFGSDDYGDITVNTPTEIASITKLFTGVLFAQFVDQNIIGIDDPVGKYLPDFPLDGPNAVTMRQCFTHAGGFYGHGLFGGVHNHWLENTLREVIKDDTVGMRYEYNGMGHDLAGKVMEFVTGKSIFRLFHEYLYEPLGMKNTFHDWDLGFSVNSTAYDLAILAQMLLNRGNYNGKIYFSEDTYNKILPKDLKTFYPDLVYSNKWDEGRPRGIGTNFQNWEINDQKTGEKKFLLSENVIGHGSATSSVFRIDLDNNIIITQSRRRGKSKFGEHFLKLYKLIDNNLVGSR